MNVGVNVPSDISISGGVTIDPYASGTMVQDFQSVSAGTYNILAGAYSIEIWNEGLQPITANAATININERFKLEAISNPVTQKMDFCPAVTLIVPAGGAAKYQTYQPS